MYLSRHRYKSCSHFPESSAITVSKAILDVNRRSGLPVRSIVTDKMLRRCLTYNNYDALVG
jgi:hypothetical protein